jgi:site-specific DNA-methyltransferase (adenine-specific)
MSEIFNVVPPSTVGRGKTISSSKGLGRNPADYSDSLVNLSCGDSLTKYSEWPSPTVIVSDGGYGILGFDGDTTDHLTLPQWYEPHVASWAKHASPATTLWFWNSEIGWAAVHPILEKYGWRYVNANIWNKGKAHLAGNVNTSKIRRFPVVTEVCVQYSLEARINNLSLQDWLRAEWKRTGLPWKKANEACGVRDAAVRKYLDGGHLWYFPPPEMFKKLADYANEYGDVKGRPYFSRDGKNSISHDEWAAMRYKFRCPYGLTNVWDRNPLSGTERIRVSDTNGRAAHLNQKPLDLMQQIILASSDEGDIIWEPFGGLFSASLAAREVGRKAYAAELDPDYFALGVSRFKSLFF